jgi:hypothetical protein
VRTGQKRYPGVEGKIVDYVQTHNEQDTLYFQVHFTDKTFLGISVVPYIRVHSADLYDASTGDYEVLKDFVRAERGRKGSEK